MNQFNLNTLNLNLIRVLEALLNERSVSKAADKLCLTQPAVSHGLKKLRDIFKDEILLRTNNGMELTTKAKELKQQVSRVLCEVENLFAEDREFDPISFSHTFKIGLIGEFGDMVILPILMKWIDQNRSSITIEAKHLNESAALEAIESGEIDIGIGYFKKLPKSVVSDILLESDFSCVVRKKHPLAKISKPTKQDYLQYGHVLTSFHEQNSVGGDKRRIQLSIDQRACLPKVIQDTDMIATISDGYAQLLQRDYNLHRFACPYRFPKIEIKLCRHKGSLSQKSLIWLVDLILSIAKS